MRLSCPCSLRKTNSLRRRTIWYLPFERALNSFLRYISRVELFSQHVEIYNLPQAYPLPASDTASYASSLHSYPQSPVRPPPPLRRPSLTLSRLIPSFPPHIPLLHLPPTLSRTSPIRRNSHQLNSPSSLPLRLKQQQDRRRFRRRTSLASWEASWEVGWRRGLRGVWGSGPRRR